MSKPRTLLLVGMQWDYCDIQRGTSLDKDAFLPAFSALGFFVEAFWFDRYEKNRKREDLQIDLLIKADEVKPDLIFFMTYTDQFDLETLDLLRQKYKTCAWFGDDHWRFDKYTRKYAPHFTYNVTTDLRAEEKYASISVTPIVSQWPGRMPTGWLPSVEGVASYEYEVSFVGGVSPYRKWFIDRLDNLGIKVTCYGHGWPNGSLSEIDMMNVFSHSKINLNISNSVSNDIRFIFSSFRSMVNWVRSPKRAEQVKARNFEIALAGGFQLSNYVVGLEEYYHIGRDIVLYNTPEDCQMQIQYYLRHEGLRRQIAESGQQVALREHTYIARIKKIVEEIGL